MKATNAIYLEDGNGQEGRPFKSRFLQAGLVKYDFGVCLLKKETIDKFVNTFIECPVIINHKDDIGSDDVVGTIQKIWFSSDDGWFWCSGVITNDTAIELIEKGYNVSCQYRITEYADNDEGKLHNANPYDKEILDGVFEHLAIVENPRYEDAFIAVNGGKYNLVDGMPTCPPIAKAYIAMNNTTDANGDVHDDANGQYTEKSGSDSNQKFNEEIDKIKSGEYPRGKQVTVSEKPSDVWLKAGLQNKKIVMPAAVFHKATTEKHNVDEETIRNFPKLLEDPPFIFKSSTEPGSFVGVLDAVEKDGEDEKPLVVAVKPVKDRVEVNIITSTYGKDKDFVRRETAKGNLLYKRKKTASNSIVALLATETLNPSDNTITDNKPNFNPNAKINIATNDYTKVFDWIKNTKGEFMDTETKNVFSQLLEALKARNEAEEDKEKKEKDKEADKATNEDVDKRKLIDEVGGILKGKVDEEVWRTIIGKIEKIAYHKSEAGTADNSKAKNENVDKRDIIRQIMAIAGKHEDNEDVRTIAKLAEKLAYDKSEAGTADNSKCKNAEGEKLYEELKEKVEKEAENKKAKNALDDAVNLLYSAIAPEPKSTYVSQAEGLALGKQIYG